MMTRLFLILGIVFVVIGLSKERTFLYSGLSFLILGLLGTLLMRKKSAPAGSEGAAKDGLPQDSNG